MKHNKVTLRKNDVNEYTLDFLHPIKSNGRIRRKVKANPLTAQKFQTAIEFLIGNEIFYNSSSRQLAKKTLMSDILYANESPENIELILDIFYKNSLEVLVDNYSFFNDYLPISPESKKILFLGNQNAKNKIIGYLTELCLNNSPKPSPVNTKIEYVLNENDHDQYKICISLMEFETLKENIRRIIDLSIEKKIFCFENKVNTQWKSIDKDFEYKFILSPFRKNSYNINVENFIGTLEESLSQPDSPWKPIFSYITEIFINTLNYNLSENVTDNVIDQIDVMFIKHKYNRYIMETIHCEDSPYNKLLNYILDQGKAVLKNIVNLISSNENIKIHYESSNDWYSNIYLNFHHSSMSDLYDLLILIGLQSSKLCFEEKLELNGSATSHSIFQLIEKARIGVPKICTSNKLDNTNTFIIVDNGSLIPSKSNFNSIENSIYLNSNEYNAINLCIDYDFSALRKAKKDHKFIKNLANKCKVYTTYCLTKEIDANSEDFLHRVNSKSTHSLEKLSKNYRKEHLYDLYLENTLIENKSTYSDKLIKEYITKITDVQKKADSTYVDDMLSFMHFGTSPIEKLYKLDFLNNTSLKRDVNSLINSLNTDVDILLKKIDIAQPMVIYDYKKLAFIFFLDVKEKFINGIQDLIIDENVDLNSIEILLRNLSQGKTSYRGSTLKPLDDLFSVFIDELTDYILNPKEINLCLPVSHFELKYEVLEMLKESIYSKIAKFIINEFTSESAKENLQQLLETSHLGIQRKRRQELVKFFDHTLTDMTQYYKSNSSDNWVDKLENIFVKSISELEDSLLY